jgi:hypothetical protein
VEQLAARGASIAAFVARLLLDGQEYLTSAVLPAEGAIHA